jgi:OmpA-OmpF porin, OOP family
MKKLILLSFTLLTSMSFSQVELVRVASKGDYNKLSLDYNIGLNKGVTPGGLNGESFQSTNLNFVHTDIGLRYMLNTKCGLKFNAGFDNLKNGKDQTSFSSNYTRFAISGIINLTNVLRMKKNIGVAGDESKFKLLFHSGLGIASLSNKKFGFIKDADNMFNFSLGLTPMYNVNDKLSINMDIVSIANLYQDYRYDFTGKYHNAGFDGGLINVSLGISYRFGMHPKHADWIQ